MCGRLRDAVDEQREPARHGRRADEVEAPLIGLVAALADERTRDGEHGHADRDVDEEDPFPTEVAREDSAEEHTGRSTAAAHRAPDSERLVAVGSLFERRRDDRQRRRRHEGRADPLHRASGDEHGTRAREPARQ